MKRLLCLLILTLAAAGCHTGVYEPPPDAALPDAGPGVDTAVAAIDGGAAAIDAGTHD